MSFIARTSLALSAPNRIVETAGRSLAYRRFGTGPDLVLCVRLRGTMDSWDPLFLDVLARHFTVTVFDYSGLGLSTGTASYGKREMARDVDDLVSALGLTRVIIGGWSLGGFAAQTFAALHPHKVSHVLAIGTMPPGPMLKPPEPLFLETATKLSNTVADEYILFFEPDSAASRALGDASMARIAARTEPRDHPTPPEVFLRSLQASIEPSGPFPDPDDAYARFYRNTDIPVLALSGDHDIMFPVENWYALNDLWPTLFVVTLPDSGHGPQHQYPEMSAEIIASFVRHTAAR
ncbi:alpha/beta fold hydrolase [Falsiroseomonas tokyonensis]|uniref:Alpha/beta fold hydrolase n=1 Tax=Falsiroseomonas tokyonensis TaxID=430521 RepID=A0ABV7BSB4_9PROT|nr:alpha/beta hydrolase [Falsiroseomonas tokyonensis]MBU8537330.1 alpha/beta hydrolase [Falsiroseomonas tokyonensis]